MNPVNWQSVDPGHQPQQPYYSRTPVGAFNPLQPIPRPPARVQNRTGDSDGSFSGSDLSGLSGFADSMDSSRQWSVDDLDQQADTGQYYLARPISIHGSIEESDGDLEIVPSPLPPSSPPAILYPVPLVRPSRPPSALHSPRSDAFTPPEVPPPTSLLPVPYPAWFSSSDLPLAVNEIEDIFLDLTGIFGFQRESMRNIYDFLMHQLDSRSSRMTPEEAIKTLHADYIGGPNANYRKWYFTSQTPKTVDPLAWAKSVLCPHVKQDDKKQISMAESVAQWDHAMRNLSQRERLRQVALYLLCWGEAANLRQCPECLCFIFKCAYDYDCSYSGSEPMYLQEGYYLRAVIKPLYRFLRDQAYEVVDSRFVLREADHDSVIGQDDINELFWHLDGLACIVLTDKRRLIDRQPHQRYTAFHLIDWYRTFHKTYREVRSTGHLLVDFNRIWVLHLSMYWYYTSYNYPHMFSRDASHTSSAMMWSIIALGGAVATVIMILATVAELSYCWRMWNAYHLIGRLLLLMVSLALTLGPTVYIALRDNSSRSSSLLVLSIVQFSVSVTVTAVFSIIPSRRIFGGRSARFNGNDIFTAAHLNLEVIPRFGSILLWLLVFGSKFAESYFFLSISLLRPMQAMVGVKVNHSQCNDRIFGRALCSNQIVFTLTLMCLVDLILFFLDTYIWYIWWSTVFSFIRTILLGLSVWAPWKRVYECLPAAISSTFLVTPISIDDVHDSKAAQLWNAIIISMYREHLLSIDHVQRLLYQRFDTEDGKPKPGMKKPSFLCSYHESKDGLSLCDRGRRRISFFAQSLSLMRRPELPVEAMPIFTVMTAHYAEKIILSLRELIREEDYQMRITTLEYLKNLYPSDWESLVQDSKILDGLNTIRDGGEADDMPFYAIGFKSSAPEYTLRVRIWASLRMQCVFRTVSGVMNYGKAIKMLYRIENGAVIQQLANNSDELDSELDRMARRKFKYLIAMQRYSKFNREEMENAEFLLRTFPDLQIAYLEDEAPVQAGEDIRLYCALIDGHSELDPVTGKRRPKFRVELPGNPILGDGKSDNQNHAIIFHRGEYLQLIDANQDNYLEECLKIRSILAEFEELAGSNEDPYSPSSRHPVAIVGAREHIFTTDIGVLGDLAALKEQTKSSFQTGTLSWLGAKFGCEHPDFFNAIFMFTRGGIAKARKGLHLAGSVYAGLTALSRGGLVKHVEYYQCGKGRDLGFGTILNFQTRNATAMSEQMLSREYHYLGTQLPLDRLLTVYYGHVGYYVQQVLTFTSIQVLTLTLVYLGTLFDQLMVCEIDMRSQTDCYNLAVTLDWTKRTIYSIFVVFAIDLLPLFCQELVEHGMRAAMLRFAKHLLSFSPLFDIISKRIDAHAFLSNLELGGARYIATGRGLSTSRISFAMLFSRFAHPLTYVGVWTSMLLLYITISFWIPHLVYLWIVIAAICLSPFIFNPHQFERVDFLIDYREFLRWMNRGNSRAHSHSWINFHRFSRSLITGYKKKRLGHPSERLGSDVPPQSWRNIFFPEVVLPACLTIILVVAYLFVKSFPEYPGQLNPTPLRRLAIFALAPIAWNGAILAVQFVISLLMGSFLHGVFPRFGASMAFIVHILALTGFIVVFELFWVLELWNVSHAVLGFCVIIQVNRAICQIMTTLLSREPKHDEVNRAWWSGIWYGRGLGSSILTLPFREFLVKIMELSYWSADMVIGHILLFICAIPLLVPFIGRLHSLMLFWVNTSAWRAPIYTTRYRAQRRWIAIKYGIVFILALITFVALVALPLVFKRIIQLHCTICQSI